MTLPRYGGALDLVVQGYALRPEYFYKGKIAINEFYNHSDLVEETDIKNILWKLKREFETDIMVEPDDDTFEVTKDASGQNTESEYELSVAASTVNAQIDKLMDRIPSEHSNSTKSISELKIGIESAALVSASPSYLTKSETDFNSLLLKSERQFKSDVSVKQFFKFSELEDGPDGIGSAFGFKSLEKAIKNTSEAISATWKCPMYEEFIEATSKIVSFIDKKEKEQIQDFKKFSK